MNCKAFFNFFQVSELQSELGDERSGADTITHLLSTEVSERMRLEKELKELHVSAAFPVTLKF